MSFNFWSLDYVYYPVSGILWVWHKVFGSILGPDNGWAWVLSVVFLVFSLRALLFKPFMKQMHASQRMAELQPQMKKIREKYKDDRQRQTEELMKLNKEAGVNPLAGCLPALIQAPVFIGLFHVLRSFRPGWDQVYFFGSGDVQSFVDAKLFGGAPLSAFITMPTAELLALQGVRSTVVAVAVPLMILAGIATYFTSRKSIARQSAEAADQPQTRVMNKVMLYLFPLGVILGGPFFPLAILFYWLSNNTWTLFQLWVAHRVQDKQKIEVAQVVEAEESAKRFSTPKPGARPQDPRRPVVTPTPVDQTGDVGTGAASNGQASSTARPTPPRASPPRPGSAPSPGARPTQRKKPRKR